VIASVGEGEGVFDLNSWVGEFVRMGAAELVIVGLGAEVCDASGCWPGVHPAYNHNRASMAHRILFSNLRRFF